MTRAQLPYGWDGKKPITRADRGMSIKVEGQELVYRCDASGHMPERNTRYLILNERPTMPRGEARLVDDNGQTWWTGAAYVNLKGTFGDGEDRMLAWKLGEADARDGYPSYHMQQQRRPVGSHGEWENYKSSFSIRATGWTGQPHAFKSEALAFLRWLPEEQPAYEWRGRVFQWVNGYAGRPHTVYPDGKVVPDN
ncbi:hypothetical protein F3K40_31970 [Streptomyces sp. LBUM 1478]|uniref:Uncharacterized protein n=2 Tax=Streptomyces TaxID=1883 RepID=L7F4R9_STRT8|nr:MULTISPECIES: hypothetical protein [Streptomyces]MBK3640153.1 hypothetical protein [Streptomyces sp. MBT33]MBP5897899.1 hypothetical protein [Streptomyces sp. LBUM 1488]MBP5909335.1 hypothetical protein [Streptomyces sp. LBUM 1478]ELP66099.1 hypothetical protein STRTUCAR8_01509 [Streptomyces turgidiscabies Car8]MDX3499275.1 hypothetical protein [Streptomyces turgidiscabies]